MSHEVAVAKRSMNSSNEFLNNGNTVYAEQRSNGLWEAVRVLRKRYKWIAGITLVCLLLAITFSLLMRPSYSSTATIELNKSGSGSMGLGLDDGLAQQLMPGAESLLTELQTETSILQSDSLALDVIERLHLADQAPFALPTSAKKNLEDEAGLPLSRAPKARSRLLAIFRSRLSVRPVRGTRLIQVAFEMPNRDQAAEITNALIDSYKNHYLQSHYTATTEASDWLTNQLDEMKKAVEESQKKLTDFEKQSGIFSLGLLTPSSDKGGVSDGAVHSVVMQKLDELNSELTAAEANRIQKEAIYRFAKSGNADVILGIGNDPIAAGSGSSVLSQGGGLSILGQLRQKRADLKVAQSDAATKYGVNNRHLHDIETQVKAVDDEISQEVGRIVKRAEVDYHVAADAESNIRKQFSEQQAAANRVNENAVQFAVLSQEAYSRKRLYEDLYTRLQEANVSAGIKATNITIVDPARPQASPVRPNTRLNVAVALLGGLFLGLVCAFLVENLDRTVATPGQVEEITAREVLTLIPDAHEAGGRMSYRYIGRGARKALSAASNNGDESMKGSANWMIAQPHSAFAEAIRSLRTATMLSRPGQSPRVILVTSSVPGEGKTSIATSLAVSFAQHEAASNGASGNRVLVIEADMRKPRMKYIFGIHPTVGLSNVLTGTAPVEQAIVKTSVAGLDFMSSGPHPPMPSEILGSKQLDQMLKDLRQKYDYIIVDSPPALLVTDPILLSMRVDGVLWIVRMGAVTRDTLAHGAAIASRSGVPLIGYAVNGIDFGSADYRYVYGQYSKEYYSDSENS